MKTSLQWLRRYFDFNWSAEELAEILTLAGLEVENIEMSGTIPDSVVVGRIESREKHPQADKLSVCQVDIGKGENLRIVCGAPNCDGGMKVPVAQPGTTLPGGFKITRTKLRGIESEGMMCSAAELEVGKDQTGLLELAGEAKVGDPVTDWLNSDTVIEWEITPNRPDWLSHIGIAREIAALARRPDQLRMPSAELRPVSGSDVRQWAAIEVLDTDLCPRYTARVLTGVKIGSSPQWMQDSLNAVGVRPVNNVVDTTNYVMLECGQPLHAFDYDKLNEGKIIVRPASQDEELMTLDGQWHQLTPDNLVIADPARCIALAGVMGGGNTEISEDTTTVLLESAAFKPGNVRATARSLGLNSESSYRFERGVDWEMVEFASRRAAALLQEVAGAELIDGCLDVYPSPWRPELVPCRIARVNQLLGTELRVEQVKEYFECLGLEIWEQAETLISVNVPSFRLDLQREADLIEEVARLFGLDNIPSARPVAVVGGGGADDAYLELEQVRGTLLALGLTETMTYSTISVEDAAQAVGGDEQCLIKLANPISAEAACMRPSLLPGLLRTVAHNLAHGNNNQTFFEVGRVAVSDHDFPEERYQAGLVLSGRIHPERYGEESLREYDFFDLKGILEDFHAARLLPAFDCRSCEESGFAKGQCAELTVEDRRLAVFGQVNPELVRGMRLNHPLYIGLIELEHEFKTERRKKTAQPLPQFPSTTRDISMTVPFSVSHRDILAVINEAGSRWLEGARLFDLFEDPETLGSDRRSLAYSLVYRDQGRTLTDEEATREHEKIKSHLKSRLAVEFR